MTLLSYSYFSTFNGLLSVMQTPDTLPVLSVCSKTFMTKKPVLSIHLFNKHKHVNMQRSDIFLYASLAHC